MKILCHQQRIQGLNLATSERKRLPKKPVLETKNTSHRLFLSKIFLYLIGNLIRKINVRKKTAINILETRVNVAKRSIMI